MPIRLSTEYPVQVHDHRNASDGFKRAFVAFLPFERFGLMMILQMRVEVTKVGRSVITERARVWRDSCVVIVAMLI